MDPNEPAAAGPRAIAPGVSAGVTEAMVERQVHAFYAKVRSDPTLGPVFDQAIGDGWDHHLAKMCDFWSSVLLMTGRYKGKPIPAHVRLPGIGAAHFVRWLELFRQTADTVCPPAAAALFVDRAERIAESLQLGIAFHRGELSAHLHRRGPNGGVSP